MSELQDPKLYLFHPSQQGENPAHARPNFSYPTKHKHSTHCDTTNWLPLHFQPYCQGLPVWSTPRNPWPMPSSAPAVPTGWPLHSVHWDHPAQGSCNSSQSAKLLGTCILHRGHFLKRSLHQDRESELFPLIHRNKHKKSKWGDRIYLKQENKAKLQKENKIKQK